MASGITDTEIAALNALGPIRGHGPRFWYRGRVKTPSWCDPNNPIGPPKEILVEGVDVRSPEFLRTRAWRTLRYRALCEGGRQCECCGAKASRGAILNVDHIKPRKLRPDLALDPWILQILCEDCNAGKGNTDQTDWR